MEAVLQEHWFDPGWLLTIKDNLTCSAQFPVFISFSKHVATVMILKIITNIVKGTINKIPHTLQLLDFFF